MTLLVMLIEDPMLVQDPMLIENRVDTSSSLAALGILLAALGDYTIARLRVLTTSDAG